jgi:hypothetical protein
MTNPYIDQAMAKQIEALLFPHLQDGEDCAAALERLLRARDVATCDRSHETEAYAQLQAMRRVFVAAIRSQPSNKLAISRAALEDARTSDSIARVVDPASNTIDYYIMKQG